MARQRPRQRNKQAKTIQQDRQDNKTKTRKKDTLKKLCGFRPKSRKAASLQRADGFIFYMSTYAFYTSGHFDTCVKMKITRVEITTKKEQAVQM